MPALRRTAFAALAAALALTLGSRAGAQTVVVGPRGIGVSTVTGGLVTVPVVADMTASGGASLGSLTGLLSWRPAVARFVGATLGTAGPVALNPDTTLGQLRFALANAGGATGTPVLVNVTFQALGAPNDTSTLGISLSEITAAGTFANLLPITTATSALFCVAGGRYGDIDGNDSLKSNDALFIITQAVGIAIPYPTFNGDVDNDGKVDTRDALIVLSYVVGLPTTGFRVGQLNAGGCAVRGAATVAIQPATPALVVGDQVPLTAVVRDSAGAVTNAQSLAWVTRDPAVATVDAAGRVTAVGAGATRVVAIVAPGLMDSATITVGSVRHTWWVNPAAGPPELGSQAYPFATLQAAVDRAAPTDTVRLVVADVGAGARITKPLVVIGDSTAAGVPVVRATPNNGPALLVDSLSGTLTLRRLRLQGAFGGVIVHNSSGATLILDNVAVERSRARGLSVDSLAAVRMFVVDVQGAVGVGISARDVAVVDLDSVRVDLLSEATPGAGATTLDVLAADTVRLRAFSLRTGRVVVDSVRALTMRRGSLAESAGPLLMVTRLADSVDLDSVSLAFSGPPGGAPGSGVFAADLAVSSTARVRLVDVGLSNNGLEGLRVVGGASLVARRVAVDAGGGALVHSLKVSGVPSVTIAQSFFSDGRVLIEDTAGVGGAARVDSTSFNQAPLTVSGFASFAMRGGVTNGGDSLLVFADSTPTVSVVGVELKGAQPGYYYYGVAPFALVVLNADSVRADSLWAHDNQKGALRVVGARVATSYGSVFQNNNIQPGGGTNATVLLADVQRSRIAQSRFEEPSGGTDRSVDVEMSYAGTGRLAVVDSNTFLTPGYTAAVYAYSPSASYLDTLVVRGNAVRPGTPSLGNSYGFQVYYFNHVAVHGNTLDSSRSGSLITVYYPDTVDVRNNALRAVQGGIALYGSAGRPFTVVGNSVACLSSNYGNSIFVYGTGADVTGNTVGRCGSGIYLFNSSSPVGANIRGNTVTTDSVGQIGIQLEGYWNKPVIAGNDVGAGSYATGIYLYGSYGGIDSARVDSNTVHDGHGGGIGVYGTVNGASLRGNLLQRQHANTSPYQGALEVNHTGGGIALVANRFEQNAILGMKLTNSGDTIRLDSNVVVDDSMIALSVEGPVTVKGRYNFFARNQHGITGSNATVVVDSSVFQQNRGYGVASVYPWDVRDNYWGDPAGPNCPSGCPATAGDSVYTGPLFVPFLTAPPSTPTGVPPALPVRGASVLARPAAGATRAVSVPFAPPPQRPAAPARRVER